MSATYVISDTHWGHRNICKYRPEFSTPQEHDRAVIEGILSVAAKSNTLWILGDCFFTFESLNYLGEACGSTRLSCCAIASLLCCTIIRLLCRVVSRLLCFEMVLTITPR